MATDRLDSIRKLLIRVGKVLPFIVCLLLFISYIENIYALYNNNFLYYKGYCVLSKPISNYIGNIFEYNLQTLFILALISFAIRTCIYNKLACLYLGVHLYEKSYFSTIELYPEYIYIICITNILISGFFVYNGIKILLK